MTALSTRDVLAKALQDAIEDECPHEPDEHAEGTCEVCDYTFALPELLADALFASGAVIDAATLADDGALVERLARGRITTDYAGTPTAERIRLNIEAKEVRDVLRALAAALAERAS